MGFGVVLAQDPAPLVVQVEPTYSFEAVAVNDIPVPAGTRKLTVAIGDVITCKMFIRDWSPNGEQLRAYQIQLDPASFSTGEQGVIQPVDFQQNPDNDPNAFIDKSDPQWAHKGPSAIAMVDSVSEGYRFLSVVEDPKMAPVAAQDGKKFVCGIVKMTPSSNAKGTFQLGVTEDPFVSSLITSENEPVVPIAYEKLTVEISPTAQWRRMLGSIPPSGAVDARKLKDGGRAGAWNSVTLQFSGIPAELSPGDVKIEDGSASPPKIKKISGEGKDAVIELDRGLRVGAWTTFTHVPSKTSTKIGCFPGDVNADGKTGSADVDTLIKVLNRSASLPDYRTDLDGDGKLAAGDLLGLLDIIAGSPTKRSANK